MHAQLQPELNRRRIARTKIVPNQQPVIRVDWMIAQTDNKNTDAYKI
jgi:hypothetical protein